MSIFNGHAYQLNLGKDYRHNLCQCGGRMMRWKNDWSIFWKCEFSKWYNGWKHDFRIEGTYR